MPNSQDDDSMMISNYPSQTKILFCRTKNEMQIFDAFVFHLLFRLPKPSFGEHEIPESSHLLLSMFLATLSCHFLTEGRTRDFFGSPVSPQCV